MTGLSQDIRYALRGMLNRPGFTAVAVLTLALGIGATTALYSVVRGVLLRPLPYPESERLVQLWQVDEDGDSFSWSRPNFVDVRAQSRSFGALAEYTGATVTATGRGDPEQVPAAWVSGDFFAALGVRPVVGRTFAAEEMRSAAPVVVVGHGYWQNRLGGDRAVVGEALVLDGRAHTVIGVMPASLDLPAGAELWLPAPIRADASRTAHGWRVVGRLATDVSLEAARSEVSAIAERLRQRHGEDTWMVDAAVIPLREELVGHARPALLVLLGAAAVLLLIAGANVANLLLARTAARGRETAVRLALGAGRRRLVQQFLSESLVLSLAGGALGVLLTVWGVDALLALEPGRLPRVEAVGVDWTVLAVALGLSVLIALAIGLAAAVRATKADVRESLAEGGRTQAGDTGGGRVRGALVAAQVALTLVLLAGGGLLARSFASLLAVDPGYRTDGPAVVMELPLPDAERPEEAADPFAFAPGETRGSLLLDEVVARLGALPGVEQAGGVDAFPLLPGGPNGSFLELERPDEVTTLEDFRALMAVPSRRGYADFRIATAGYFRAMGIPVLRGRMFREGAGPDVPHEAVVSASLAEAQWPDGDPLGKLIQFGNMDGDARPFTVVGVVGDVRDRSLAGEPRPTFYGNARQRTAGLGGRFNLVVRGGADPSAVIASARRIMRELAPAVPVRFRALDDVFAASLADRRFSLLLLGLFGASALVLAAMGIYGVIAYMVAQRTREIGIRMALGAARGRVVHLVVGRGLVLTLAGLAVGLAAALAGTRVLSSQLYGVSANDPVAFGGAAVLLAAVALLASWIPARRATRLDPMIALRRE